MALDKMSILNAPDLKREVVDVPEWGGEIIVQEITALDRDRLWNDMRGTDGNIDPINMACKVLVRCLVDEEGSRLYCDEEAEALGRKSTRVINRLFDIAKRLNRIDPEEDAVKN